MKSVVIMEADRRTWLKTVGAGLAGLLLGGCATTAVNDNSSLLEETIKHSNFEEQKRYAVLLVDASYSDSEEEINLYGDSENYINLDQELRNMSQVLLKANQKNIPVYDIHFSDCALKKHGVPCSVKKTQSTLRKLKGKNWREIRKDEADSFEGTQLHEYLKSQGITDLIIMGQNQNVCLRATTKTAAHLGYKVHVSFDVMQGFKSNHSESELGYEKDMEFYQKNTKLVKKYTSLPIF
jgi:isochorismate hydrolase